MATEFLRLYKDLCRGDQKKVDSGLPPRAPDSDGDAMYENLRLQVMTTLGFDVGLAAPTRVLPPKYHGKAARRAKEVKNITGELASTVSSRKKGDTLETAKRKAFLDAMIETDRINKVAKEIESLTSQGKPIPNTLVLKLANEKKTRGAVNVVDRNVVVLPPLSTAPRELSVIRKDQSRHKWSQQEIEKVQSLFEEVPKPSATNQLDAWQYYYKTLAVRFRSLYGGRGEREVIEKMQFLVLKRQLKEAGERDFWDMQSRKAQENQQPTFSKSSRFPS